MQLEEAVRGRRTIKAYRSDPVDDATLEELFELARWAPNHHLTEPWRFRVVGPKALAALKKATGKGGASKLDRAPTLVVCSAVVKGNRLQREEDAAAAACAAYIVLLAAHARGLAGYWRTPEVLRTKAGRKAVGLRKSERFVGLLYLGTPRQAKKPPRRSPVEDFVTRLP